MQRTIVYLTCEKNILIHRKTYRALDILTYYNFLIPNTFKKKIFWIKTVNYPSEQSKNNNPYIKIK